MINSVRYFFEIPVYRCSQQDHHLQQDTAEQEYLAELDSRGNGDIWQSSGLLTIAKERFRTRFGSPWHYNQIIGWIRLYVLGEQIRGECFFVEGKRVLKRRKYKRFIWYGKAFEMEVEPFDTSREIYESLIDELMALSNERPFKGRHIELEMFQQTGPFIDWRAFIDTRQE